MAFGKEHVVRNIVIDVPQTLADFLVSILGYHRTSESKETPQYSPHALLCTKYAVHTIQEWPLVIGFPDISDSFSHFFPWFPGQSKGVTFSEGGAEGADFRRGEAAEIELLMRDGQEADRGGTAAGSSRAGRGRKKQVSIPPDSREKGEGKYRTRVLMFSFS